ncbi:MAG: flippase [Dehalococcoidia bacterium]|nr:MAG: flippase [Dehalococcoidia bacterium]
MLRGTLYLIIANGVFSVVGYIIHFWIGRHLGPAEYGIFGVVIYLMTTVNLFITSGFPQSASKYIAEDYSRAGSIIRDANRIQFVFCIIIFGLYFGLSGVIANLFDDPSLTSYIRISTLGIPAYAFFSVYSVGYLNGLRRFSWQALASIGSSITKLAVVFGSVLLGFGVGGALVGYIIAAIVGFVLAWKFLNPLKKSKSNFGWKKLVGFGIPATIFAATFFLLMNIDLFVVKAIGGGEAETGYYASATTISRVPHFLIAGLAMTLLPSISRSTSLNNIELTKSYIQQSVRFMLMALIPGVLVVSATSADLLTLLYSSSYLEAAIPLSILVFGVALLTIFYVLSNIILGINKPWIVLSIVLLLAGVDIALSVFLISSYGLVGAAWATTITGLIGMSLVAGYIFTRFRTLICIKSLLRILFASGVVYGTTYFIPSLPLWLPAIYIGLSLVYIGILWVTKELTKDDLNTVMKLIPFEMFNSARQN